MWDWVSSIQPFSEGLGTFFAAVVTLIGTAILASKRVGGAVPPPSPIPVTTSVEFDEAINRLEHSVTEVKLATMDARATIGSLGGQIQMLHHATTQIQPLGERTAVLEHAVDKIVEKVDQVFEKLREVNHTVRNVQQNQQAHALIVRKVQELNTRLEEHGLEPLHTRLPDRDAG